MEQFDEIEKLFKQLEDAGNSPIPESHLNDLYKRLDNYSPSATNSAFNKISAFKAAAVVVIAASTVYFLYNKFSAPTPSTSTTITTNTSSSSTNSPATGIKPNEFDSNNITDVNENNNSVNTNDNTDINSSSGSQNNNSSYLVNEKNQAIVDGKNNSLNTNDNANINSSPSSQNNSSSYLVNEKNKTIVDGTTKKLATGNTYNAEIPKSPTVQQNSATTLSNSNKTINKGSKNNSASPSGYNSEKSNDTLFKLISSLNTINQLVCENEGIAEIKYIVEYKLVNPLIYLTLPNGLNYSYNNNILVIKGTPENIWGKQVVSIKAKANNISDSVSFIITIIQKPKAKFSYSPSNGASPLNVKFTNNSKGSNSYIWDFGDGNNSTNENPTNTYVSDGIYHVKLKAIANSDKSKCEDVTTLNIVVGRHSIPNSFTPNGDNVNDLFVINPLLDLNFKAEIFNVRSEKVADLNSNNNTWDGDSMSDHSKCPEGIYFYIITFTDNQGGIVKVEKGSIQLLR